MKITTASGPNAKTIDTKVDPTSPMIECIAKLRDYLLESHQEELDTNHHGDGPEGCTYCAAIKEATEILKSYGRE